MISPKRRAYLEGARPEPATAEEEDYLVNLRIAREKTGARARCIARGEAVPRRLWTNEEELSALTSELGEVRSEIAGLEASITSAESESVAARKAVGEVEREIIELNRRPDLVEFNRLTQEGAALDNRIAKAVQLSKLLDSYPPAGL